MAIEYNPRIVTDGLVLALDAANIKSYSAKNLFENPTDILSWMGTAITSTHNGSVSRDTTVSSPVGNSPMKMVCTGTSAYTQTWGNSASAYLISSASQGETFTVSVWAKSASGTTLADCEIFIFDANSSGSWNSSDNTTYSKGTFTVTDTWQRFSFTRTTSWSSTANIQARFDGPQNGTGTLWWDGMQVERSSTATDFSYNGPSTVLDMSDKDNSGSISNLTHTSGTDGYFDFNGTNGYIRPSNSSDFSFGTGDFAVEFWVYYKGSGSKFSVDTRTTVNGAGFDFGFSTNAKIWDTSINDWLYDGSTTYGANTWHHVVFTRSGTTISVYVDGSLDGTATSSRNLTETGCYIGANVNISYSSGSYSNARASNVRIYKGKSLSSAEVKQNFDSTKLRYGRSVLWQGGGQVEFTTSGSYNWEPPPGVTAISVVAVGGGGGSAGFSGGNGPGSQGGAGGALAYKNNWQLTPGQSVSITVGAGGVQGTQSSSNPGPGGAGGDTTVTIGSNTMTAGGGGGGTSGTTTANNSVGQPSGYYDGGGNGGSGGSGGPDDGDDGNPGGGGGAGGYSGNGGNGGNATVSGTSGTGGAGGGGSGGNGTYEYGAGGGGVGLQGEGSNGSGGTHVANSAPSPGQGGSGGDDGVGTTNTAPIGGNYGAGAGAAGGSQSQNVFTGYNGGGGAVRIIWGFSRYFPSTNTADV